MGCDFFFCGEGVLESAVLILIFRGWKVDEIILFYQKIGTFWRGLTQRCARVSCSGARIPLPEAIALSLIKFTTAAVSVRKRQKCQKTSTKEGPDYCHPAGLVGGGRIFFRSNILSVYLCFDSSGIVPNH